MATAKKNKLIILALTSKGSFAFHYPFSHNENIGFKGSPRHSRYYYYIQIQIAPKNIYMETKGGKIFQFTYFVPALADQLAISSCNDC